MSFDFSIALGGVPSYDSLLLILVRYFNPYGDSFQMPCNAHGHPPFCECGWGGVNYDPWKPKLKVNWSQATSHTIPNASCPVCSAKVFFYRSPDGGAVFFDDLGPPWPKHPCTSNGAHRLTEKIFEERNKKKKNKRKKNSSWWPYPCSKSESLPNGEGACLYGIDDKRLYVKTKASNIPSHTPIWIRPFAGEPGKYQISTFQLIDGSIKEKGYVAYSRRGLRQPSAAALFHLTTEHLRAENHVQNSISANA